jgi:predicted amidophosphoribosyltransferase
MFGVDDVCVFCGHPSRVYYIINNERFCSTCYDDLKQFEECEVCIRRKMRISRTIIVVGEEEEVHEGSQPAV